MIASSNGTSGAVPVPTVLAAVAGPAVLATAARAAPQAQPKKPRRKWLIAALVAAPVIAAAAVATWLLTRPAAPQFRTALVVRADITERVTATGTLQPVVTSPVGAQVSGIVWKLHADFNSQVKAGDLLVELDPALFQNTVAMATAQLAQAVANLTGAQAVALGARSVRDRTRTLERASLTSNADLEATQAILGQTSGAARSSAAQIAQARAQLDRARLDLEHSSIHSPVDGTVISRNVDVGQAVAATLTAPTLFTIAQDLHHMQVHAAVDEADIGEVRPGQEATFTVDAFRDQTFRATVREVRNAPQTAQNVVTYDVVLDVENPEVKLRPGMTANVLILIVQKLQTLAVPNEALRFRPAGPAAAGAPKGPAKAAAKAAAKPAAPEAAFNGAVYVPLGGGSARLAVRTGVTDGTLTEVEGLAEGREVIVDAVRTVAKAPPASSGQGRGP